VADLKMFCELWMEPRVMVHMGFPKGLPITQEEIEAKLLNQPNSKFDRLLVVEIKETGQAIGECKLSQPDEDGVAEPDIKLLPTFWGHKYGMEVWRGITEYQFRDQECKAVQTTPNVENYAAIKMYEAAGSVREGEGIYHFPEDMQDFTKPVHHYVYRLYRAAWEHN